MRKFFKAENPLSNKVTKSQILFLTLAVTGVLTKVYSINFILGLSYSLSSLFLLVIVQLYNINLAVVAALAAQLIGAVNAGYPTLSFVSVLEIAFIGVLKTRKAKGSMIVWDIIFWALIGVPVSALVYYCILDSGNVSTFNIQVCRDITNGIFNCILADAVLTYMPLKKWMGLEHKKEASFHFYQFLFHLTTIIIVVVFLLSFAINSTNTYNTMLVNDENLAVNYSNSIEQEVKQWDADDIKQLNLLGNLQIGKLELLIEKFASDGQTDVTITNSQDRIIATNIESMKSKEKFKWTAGGKIESLTGGFYQYLPDSDFHTLTISNWAKGSYIYTRTTNSPVMNIIVRFPIKQFQQEMLNNYLQQVRLLMYLLLCSAMFAFFTNRFLVKTLKQLSSVTTGLPGKIRNTENIEWPNSKVSEIKLLIDNFKNMSGNLKNMFKESHDLNETLAIQTEKLKRSEEKLHNLAYYDNLTCLRNRLAFKHYLTGKINAAKDEKSIIAVMFMDINQFKQINDTMGHSAGDDLLRILAKRLEKLEDNKTSIFRLGGDEFVVVITAEDVSEVRSAGDNVMNVFSSPIKLHGSILHVTGSIGVSMFPEDGGDLDTLVKYADMAMYSSKEKGGSNVQFFYEGINRDFEEYVTIDNGIREALENNQFELYYQPKVNAQTGQISSAEALLRCKHPKLGCISPARFIPVAEKSGLIFQIDEWVVNEACRQNMQWQEEGMEPIPISVNMSAKQFYEDYAVNVIENALHKSGLAAKYLKVEITEGVLIKNTKHAVNIIHRLKDLGISVSIDDFGMGYSSLSQLVRLPISEIKLDREFTREISSDIKKASMVKLIVEFAHNLNLNVVAEGVETEEEMDYLKAVKCDELQGFIFSKPVNEHNFRQLLQETLNLYN